MRQTVRRFGVGGLYRGISSYLVFAFPRGAIRFYVYEETAARFRARRSAAALALHPAPRPLSPWENLAAGGLAGMVEAALVIVPMTTIQIRMIGDLNSASPQYRGLIHGVSQMWRAEGPAGLYRGAGPTLLKIVFNISFRFMLYDQLTAVLGREWDGAVAHRHRAQANLDRDDAVPGSARGVAVAASPASPVLDAWKQTAVSLAAGALAGAITVVANQPVDVVKSNLQCAPRGRHASAWACARTLLADEGLRGWYKGTLPRVIRVALETALSFTFYQQFSAACNQLIDGRP